MARIYLCCMFFTVVYVKYTFTKYFDELLLNLHESLQLVYKILLDVHENFIEFAVPFAASQTTNDVAGPCRKFAESIQKIRQG